MRPRVAGMDEKIIQAFIERGLFKNQNEVVSAALRALVREQRQMDSERQNEESLADQTTYDMQLEGHESATESSAQKMGNLVG
nr:hypothetical protein HAGR004_40730 [Bdellovibrio sp. HAGR004]BFD69116.1 hypothetical protein HAGR004_41380 [Bdellovibrio sp. HAGR004]